MEKKKSEAQMRMDVLMYVYLMIESVYDKDLEWAKEVRAELNSIKWANVLGIPMEKIVKMIERTQNPQQP